ncbi:MAG: pyridoxal phosphate-dependent aminotransferase family protein [Candidatus Marinimicrobia bacterium]|nr:pyridoxal phosphate-dependent aminotransferase family protein [Candidatus Neomarinimicrobiota bacterium]
MQPPVLHATDPVHVIWNDTEYLFFGGYDYHRLSRHPGVLAAAENALRTSGLNSGGARGTTGTHPLHLELEARLSTFLGTADSVFLPAGFMANLALLESLAEEDYICYFHPECHPSLTAAIRMSGLPKIAIAASIEDLESEIAWNEKKPLIVTDGLYGTLPPLPDYLGLAEKYDGLLIIDEAHALGILGKHGRGAAEHFGLQSERILLSGSLSKAAGSGGGFVSGPAHYMDAVRRTCTYGTTSAVSLPVTAAGIAALDFLSAHTAMIADFRERCLKTKQALADMGFPVPVIPTPVIGIIVPETDKTVCLKDALIKAGIYPSLIRYHGKPDYFRFALSSAHSEGDIERLLDVLGTFRKM